LHRRGELTDLARTAHRTQMGGFALGGLICLSLALLAGPLLGLINPAYTDGRGVLAVLAAGQFLAALYTGQDSLLAMTGHGGALRTVNLLQLGTLIVLSLALMPSLGSMGAAITAAVVTALGALCSAATVAAYLPEVAPRLAPPLPNSVRHWILRSAA
jgi:O-antigen/teichoic acid export membrane protein